jgi:hypothetical protein
MTMGAQEEERPPAEAPRRPAAPTGARVLLAEDNPVNQALAAAMLRTLGCQVAVLERWLPLRNVAHAAASAVARGDAGQARATLPSHEQEPAPPHQDPAHGQA